DLNSTADKAFASLDRKLLAELKSDYKNAGLKEPPPFSAPFIYENRTDLDSSGERLKAVYQLLGLRPIDLTAADERSTYFYPPLADSDLKDALWREEVPRFPRLRQFDHAVEAASPDADPFVKDFQDKIAGLGTPRHQELTSQACEVFASEAEAELTH